MNEYRKMWADLGIDLEKHDKLLAALPSLYKDIYLTQTNRPEKMDYYDFVVSEIHGLRIKELVEGKEKDGKVIGAFCVYVPEEIILASGSTCIGLCGGAEFSIPDAEKVLPRDLCPLIKSSFGFKIGRTCPYFQVCDMLVGETTCDGKKKMYELLNEYVPTYVLELPQKPETKQARDLWLAELEAFKEKMEELTGNRITAESLREAIEKANRKRKVLQRLYATRKTNPTPISGKDALLIAQIAFYDDIERFVQKTSELCEELGERIEKGGGVADEDTPRIMISGTPMAIPNWKLHHVIETSGGVVVCEESCTGTRYFTDLVEENGGSIDDQLAAIADRYLQINCSCFTPNEDRVKQIIELVKDYKVDGVVYYVLQYCHGYNVEYAKVEKALKDAKIPIIKIQTDYSSEDVGQIKTRIEAFLEMLA